VVTVGQIEERIGGCLEIGTTARNIRNEEDRSIREKLCLRQSRKKGSSEKN
jgi:hypothetical protein